MQSKKIKFEDTISPAEWEVMRVIWTLGPTKTSRMVQIMNDKMSWHDSTTKTFLARLTKKGFLNPTKVGREFCYQSEITEEEAIDKNVEEVFTNICSRKIGKTINHILNKVELSQDDIQKMRQLLNEKAKTAPKEVPCDCIFDDYFEITGDKNEI